MKQRVTELIAALLVMMWAVTGWTQTNLTVVRHADNTLWKMTCDGTSNCSAWTRIRGGFSSPPTLTWDPAINKYILMGIGNNGSDIWRSTFNADGTWNNDWTKLTGGSPSPVAVSGGGFLGGLGVYDGSGLFLGYLAPPSTGTLAGNVHNIYNPDIPGFLRVEFAVGINSPPPPHLSGCSIAVQFFRSQDCSGQAYNAVFYGCLGVDDVFIIDGKTYLYDPEIPLIQLSEIESFRDFIGYFGIPGVNGTCRPPIDGWQSNSSPLFPIKQIETPPLFNQTLQHPILVRPIH